MVSSPPAPFVERRAAPLDEPFYLPIDVADVPAAQAPQEHP